jgi:hypothetical protein
LFYVGHLFFDLLGESAGDHGMSVFGFVEGGKGLAVLDSLEKT